MNESNLCTLYEIASRTPGWLSRIQAACALNDEEVGFLIWLDDQESKVNKKLREMECRMRRDGFDETLIDCETDDDRLVKLNKLIFTIEDCHKEMRMLDKPYLERAIFLLTQRYDHWVKLRKKIRAKMIHLPINNSFIIPEADIEKARHIPFEEFCEVSKKFTNCLWHDDSKPSMLISNGFGWCFACGTWCDPIKWWMKNTGQNFPETVRALCRI